MFLTIHLAHNVMLCPTIAVILNQKTLREYIYFTILCSEVIYEVNLKRLSQLVDLSDHIEA